MSHIRLLEPRDMAASAAVIRDSFADVARRFTLTPDNCPSNGAFLEEAALLRDLGRGVIMFGLFTETRQAGFVAVKARPERSRDGAAATGGDSGSRTAVPAEVWFLEKLAVLPEHRDKGFGSALVTRALEHARAEGARRVSIGVIAGNLPLVAWYEGRGFRRTQQRDFPNLPFTVQYMEYEI